ncbi:glycosyltransferase family 2 protein [Methanobrevibacter sp.]|uniref:glycosyltransferase family 2 protein n=1 Tax=Methanobrevibacter sp. TaxID=66852 RepID=UPI0025FAD702|nr:glycosyltransferase family 2 protein [Methanobrevibacter sp.]MBQ6511792.1 glycosyltransferase family 2 protein [Methanobrevibacter sp.]
MSDSKDEIFVVVPAYNEEKTVSQIIEGIANEGYNVVLVNDGSSDNTLNLAIESKTKYPNQIFIVSHVINRGLGAALKTGMETAIRKDAKYILTFDADGQHAIEDIVKVAKPLQEGKADACIGARPLKDMPISKSFANFVMNFLTLIFYGRNVRDSQSGLRAFTADAASQINIVSSGYAVSSEFIKEISDKNFRLEEVTITTIYTPETQHKGTDAIVGLKILFKMILDLFRI